MTDFPETENEALKARNELKPRMTPIRQEDTKMKRYELNENEMKQVCGGNFFADLEDVLRRIFDDKAKPSKPDTPTTKEPKTAYTC